MTGPFTGRLYIDEGIAGGYLPKLLGTPEKEWNDIVRYNHDLKFDRIIHIGAADGYYAGGLARLNEIANVVAFEAGGSRPRLYSQNGRKQ